MSEPAESSTALALAGVSKTFRRGGETVAALDDAYLSVEYGEFVSVVGPSGSGKSTLLYLAGGFLRPDRGIVSVAGGDLLQRSGRELAALRRTEVGFVFQSFHLIPTLTAAENVAVPLVADRQRQFGERVSAALDAVGLGHRAGHRPGQLSGGEMQRVAVARALVIEPSIVVADEPTGNLDGAKSASVMEVLIRAVRETNSALLLVTHDSEIARRADRTVTLADGKLS
jgi:putative ABC transport system ATP-binding protein